MELPRQIQPIVKGKLIKASPAMDAKVLSSDFGTNVTNAQTMTSVANVKPLVFTQSTSCYVPLRMW